jgi:hypothetical protein
MVFSCAGLDLWHAHGVSRRNQGGQVMTKVIANITTSVDGYVAGPAWAAPT